MAFAVILRTHPLPGNLAVGQRSSGWFVDNADNRSSSAGSSRRYAFLVDAGIFLSRVAGLIRDRVFAHYFGNSDAADVFKAAFRIPNLNTGVGLPGPPVTGGLSMFQFDVNGAKDSQF